GFDTKMPGLTTQSYPKPAISGSAKYSICAFPQASNLPTILGVSGRTRPKINTSEFVNSFHEFLDTKFKKVYPVLVPGIISQCAEPEGVQCPIPSHKLSKLASKYSANSASELPVGLF